MPITRRGTALLLPLLVAACATGDAQPPLQPPPGYAHLTPLRLNVLEIEMMDPGPAAFRVDPPAPLSPIALALQMGRERLSAVGTTGRARFGLVNASLTREAAGGAGLFSDRTERLAVILRVRLEILGADAAPVGFAEAEVRRTATAVANDAAAQARNADQIVRQAMDDLNVEFEFQLRRNLRDWIMSAQPTAPLPGPIQEEILVQPRG